MNRLPFPTYLWVIIGMIVGAIVGWAVDDVSRWVAIGTFAGAMIAGVFYIFGRDES